MPIFDPKIFDPKIFDCPKLKQIRKETSRLMYCARCGIPQKVFVEGTEVRCVDCRDVIGHIKERRTKTYFLKEQFISCALCDREAKFQCRLCGSPICSVHMENGYCAKCMRGY